MNSLTKRKRLMIISVLKRYISALLICTLLSIPGLAAAEDEPMPMSSPQNTQQGDMSNMSNHKGMDHNGMMMDNMDGMKHKSQTKKPSKEKPSKDSNTDNNSNTSMPMENGM